MKVVLLDREGTLVVDPHHDRVDAPEKIELLPQTLNGLAYLALHGFRAIILTNQTSIAEGRVTEQGFWNIHNEVLKQLKPSGIEILKTYVCPHNSSAGCLCRKPEPAMLNEAIEEFNLNPSDTYMVGDRLSDVEAGMNVGMKTVLVETGKRSVVSEEATYTAAHLLEAAQYIVAN